MPEVTTTLTAVEEKPGDGWLLRKFTASDGKKFQTFDDDIADAARALMNQPVRITFEVDTRQQGTRTYSNNVIKTIVSASDPMPAGGGAPASPAFTRLTAYGLALETISAGLINFDEPPTFTDVTGIAESIAAWAENPGDTLDADDPTPPEPTDAD